MGGTLMAMIHWLVHRPRQTPATTDVIGSAGASCARFPPAAPILLTVGLLAGGRPLRLRALTVVTRRRWALCSAN